MKITNTQKSIILGIFVACLLTSISSGTYFSITSTQRNLPISPFEWDFDSAVKLSLQINERSEYLYNFYTHVLYTSRPYGGEGIPYFNYSTALITSWLNTLEDRWELKIVRLVDENIIEDDFTTDPDLFAHLYPAIASDISNFEDLTDVTGSIEDYMDEYFVANKTLIEVYHIYQDGSAIRFRSFDDVVFIKYERFLKYRGTSTSSGIERDKKFDVQWYMGTMPELYPAYTNAINQYLETIYGSV